MTVAPELNPRTGQLWLAEETFEALVAHATSTAGGPGTAEQLQLLQSIEAVDAQGRPHDALAGSLAAIAEPTLGNVELSYSSKTMQGWVGQDGAALLMPPGDDGRRLLTHFPLSLLPGVLAKAVDLGPRPRAEQTAPVPFKEDTFERVRRHWQLSLAWLDGDGANNKTNLEVVDTDGGMWTLRPGDNGEQVAWPSTSTRVWRQIVRLVLRRPSASDVPV